MKVLIVGGGGREHALAWLFSQTATAVFCAPGNPGTAACSTNVAVDPDDSDALIDTIRQHRIDLTVVGPETPLANGLADRLSAAGFAVFGPSAAAAQIESSKKFAKQMMSRAGVPTAGARMFTNPSQAAAYIDRHPEPLVIKASGLAAGKGAIVCDTRREARAAASQMFDGRFGDAGTTVLVEDFMIGEELSVFVITDGEHTLMLPTAQDHKRLEEADLGPNTGGMGAYSPVSIATPNLLDRVERDIIGPTIRAMAESGAPYRGFLYAGLMITPAGEPMVVEFNCRFGDPEAQVVLPVLGEDITEHIWRVAAREAWNSVAPRVSARRAAVTTVLAAPGYPDSPERGLEITLPAEPPENTLLFHAGTRQDGDRLRTSGGRVLCATGLGPSVADAAAASRALAESVEFDRKVYRRDIAWRETARAGVT